MKPLILPILISVALTGSLSAQAGEHLTHVILSETASDIQEAAVEKIEAETQRLGLSIEFHRIHPGSKGLGEVLDGRGKALFVDRFDREPKGETINTTLSSLSEATSRATYVLFVNRPKHFDWLADLNVPNNVRVAISLRGIEAPDITKMFGRSTVDTSGLSLGVDYSKALSMAVAQLQTHSAYREMYDLKPWSSGKSYLGVFDGVGTIDGLEDSEASAFFSGALATSDAVTQHWTLNPTIQKTPQFSDPSSSDAIFLMVAGNGCVSNYAWDGIIDKGLELQSFGYPIGTNR